MTGWLVHNSQAAGLLLLGVLLLALSALGAWADRRAGL